MKVNRNGKQIEAFLTGAIGESSPLFILPLKGFTELTVDMSGVTIISSIGVKNWIIWTLRVPQDCTVTLVNCPYVIASQASIVMGFLTSKIKIKSLRLPYLCMSCKNDDFHTVYRGKDFEYKSPGQPERINVPEELPCRKCNGGKLEADFLLQTTFRFLRG